MPGIELDTKQQMSRLPDGKLSDLKAWIDLTLQKRKVLLRELQELVRHLNFACRALAPGHAFLRRL